MTNAIHVTDGDKERAPNAAALRLKELIESILFCSLLCMESHSVGRN